MFGTETEEIRTIRAVTVVDNSKEGDKRRRFEIKPIDYLHAERYAEDNGITLLGIYHSHPNHPSIPSEHDRVAAQPYFSYAIVSVYERQFRSLQSWQLNEEQQFEEETILEYEFFNQT
jgi:proteasome lid subunit RPN8/RPN11